MLCSEFHKDNPLKLWTTVFLIITNQIKDQYFCYQIWKIKYFFENHAAGSELVCMYVCIHCSQYLSTSEKALYEAKKWYL